MVPSPAACDGLPRDDCVAAAGDASSVVHPYLVELVQSTVRDEVEDVEERLHRDVQHLHVDMLIRVDGLQVLHPALTCLLFLMPICLRVYFSF